MSTKEKAWQFQLLRLIAFLFIFIKHSELFIPVPWNENVYHSWLIYTPAWSAVWLFFILSGYGIGIGFYRGKYEMTVKGIFKYYYLRLIKIVPVYWIYVVMVLLFAEPSLLVPGRYNLLKVLNLFFFNYQEDFSRLTFGLAWYMTTLVRLYLIAPFFYLIKRRYFATGRSTVLLGCVLTIGGFLLRLLMQNHLDVTGVGDWSHDIFKPFYFNLDLFFVGFLLNELRASKKVTACKRIPYIAWIVFIPLVIVNCKWFYFSDNVTNSFIVRLVLPTVYLLWSCFFIVNYGIFQTSPTRELAQRRARVGGKAISLIVWAEKLLFPLYLFHSTILLMMQKGYDDPLYRSIVRKLGAPARYENFAIGCFFTALALIYTILFAIFIQYAVVPTVQGTMDRVIRNTYGKWKARVSKRRMADAQKTGQE